MNAPGLKLRWNHKHRFVQVWHFQPNRLPYVVMNAEGHYSLSQIIYELKRRQRRARELKADYEKMLEGRERDYERNMTDLSKEAAEAAADERFEKVTSSARTR
jgi:hypothetical protein